MRRILVIEDDVEFRKMLRRMLERAGYEITEAADGKEGMRLFRAAPTDLVITDILMPEQEGIETILELKREFADVKIIAISGGGHIDSKEYLETAEQFGVPRTFSKPFNREEFLAAVKELLGNVSVS
ncbi:MAG: response regulator [Phycisphaerales bacterium]|nr:MAG: response regulator [Phycisphaerales bacterium]